MHKAEPYATKASPSFARMRRLKAGGSQEWLPHKVTVHETKEKRKTHGSTDVLPEDTRDGSEDGG